MSQQRGLITNVSSRGYVAPNYSNQKTWSEWFVEARPYVAIALVLLILAGVGLLVTGIVFAAMEGNDDDDHHFPHATHTPTATGTACAASTCAFPCPTACAIACPTACPTASLTPTPTPTPNAACANYPIPPSNLTFVNYECGLINTDDTLAATKPVSFTHILDNPTSVSTTIESQTILLFFPQLSTLLNVGVQYRFVCNTQAYVTVVLTNGTVFNIALDTNFMMTVNSTAFASQIIPPGDFVLGMSTITTSPGTWPVPNVFINTEPGSPALLILNLGVQSWSFTLQSVTIDTAKTQCTGYIL